MGRFNLKLTEYGEAWNYMIREWLSQTAFCPRDSFPFEMCVTRPPRNFKDTSITEIYLPVE